MCLRAILCTFQISVDFYYVPVGGRGRGRGGAGRGGDRERVIECTLDRDWKIPIYSYVQYITQ